MNGTDTMEPNNRGKRRKRRRLQRKRRGVALLMVLGAITVLTVFLTELQQETSAELAAAIADRDALRAEYLAKSAINLSRLLIASEPQIQTSLSSLLKLLGITQVPVWQFADVALGPFNDETGMAAFGTMINLDSTTGKGLGLKGGRFELKIVPEDTKFNINRATVPPHVEIDGQIIGLLQANSAFFDGQDADGLISDMNTVCGAMTDWADDDENLSTCYVGSQAQGAAGGEDSIYQTLGLDYRRKNAPYDSLEELRLVRGVGDDFWTTFVDLDPDDPSKRNLTVWGQTRQININGANPMTLLAIACSLCIGGLQGGGDQTSQVVPLCVDPTMQLSVLTLLGIATSLPIPIFKSPKDFISFLETGTLKGLSEVPGNLFGPDNKPCPNGVKSGAKDQLTTKSRLFSIYADGIIPGRKRETRVRIHAVVDTRGSDALGNPSTDPNLPASPLGKIVYYRID